MNRPTGFSYVASVVVAGFAAPSLGPEPQNSVRFSAFSDHQIGAAFGLRHRRMAVGTRMPIRTRALQPLAATWLHPPGTLLAQNAWASTNTILSEIAHGWSPRGRSLICAIWTLRSAFSPTG